MIIILDNGGSYSDHKIAFVDPGEYAPDDIALVMRLQLGWSRCFEIARAETLEWRRGATTTLRDLFEDMTGEDDYLTPELLGGMSDVALDLVLETSWDEHVTAKIMAERWRREDLAKLRREGVP